MIIWGEFVGGDREGEEIQLIGFKDRLESQLPSLRDVSTEDKLRKLNVLLSKTIITVNGHRKDKKSDKPAILDDLICKQN